MTDRLDDHGVRDDVTGVTVIDSSCRIELGLKILEPREELAGRLEEHLDLVLGSVLGPTYTFDHHIVKLQLACVALEAHFERRPCVEGAIPRWLRGVLRSAVVVFVGVVPEPLHEDRQRPDPMLYDDLRVKPID